MIKDVTGVVPEVDPAREMQGTPVTPVAPEEVSDSIRTPLPMAPSATSPWATAPRPA